MAVDDQIAEAKSRIESLLEPVNGGVGEDVSYDDGFEQIKLEIDKLQSIEGTKPDWGMVISMSDELLSDKSKDFRVALYYAAGKAQLDSLPGVLDGLLLMQELATKFWDEMYPPLRRARARGNLIAWYSDVAAPIVAEFQPAVKDRDVVMALDEVSKAVDANMRERLEDAYGGMDALRDACRNLVRITPEEAAPPPPPPPPAAEAPAAAAAPAAAPVAGPSIGAPSAGDVTDADSAFRALRECSLTLTRCGDALREADPRDPDAYRLARVGNWLMLSETPNNDGGRSLIPGPPDHVREGLEATFKAANWEALLNGADEAGNEHILWLDAQRYVATALDRLGGRYAKAKRAVLVECAIMTMRVPELQNLSFEDDTALADGATKMWLETEVETILASGEGGGGGSTYLDEPLKEAKGLVADGDLGQAVDLLSKTAAAAPSPSDGFRARIELAKMCVQAEQFAVARAHLEGLDKMVERFRLMEWDPTLCAQLYEVLYLAYRGANVGDQVGPEALKREDQAFERLCQLDAAAALRIGSPGPSE